jgi:phosphopantetheine--protein transferase-like protein
VLLHDRWPDLSSRLLVMHRYLSALERATYEQCHPRARRQWLLGRIAVKDAVRKRLSDTGDGGVFPAEIRVYNDESGRPRVSGMHGRLLPALHVSLAHCQEAAVALVRGTGDAQTSDCCSVGIDIEEVTERHRSIYGIVLTDQEKRLLSNCCTNSGETEVLWLTKFWAAKEAVAKAEGVGLAGQPKRFEVLEIEGSKLLVGGEMDHSVRPERPMYRVHIAQEENIGGLPKREYIVAWTTGPIHLEMSGNS